MKKRIEPKLREEFDNGKIAIYANNSAEAEDLLNTLHANGYTWTEHDSLETHDARQGLISRASNESVYVIMDIRTGLGRDDSGIMWGTKSFHHENKYYHISDFILAPYENDTRRLDETE